MNSVRRSDSTLNARFSGYPRPIRRAPSKGALRETLKRVSQHEATLVVAVVMAPVAVALLAAL
jgi:hypothetical protein